MGSIAADFGALTQRYLQSRFRNAGPASERIFPVRQKDDTSASATSTDGAKRPDGRGPTDMRPIFLGIGVLSRSSGSCYAELGSTKVAVSVHGPKPERAGVEFSAQGKLAVQYRLAQFARRDERGDIFASDAEVDASVTVRQALEPSILLSKLPKSVVEVQIMVLEDDGSALGLAITAASAALASAGIEMIDLVAASTCSTLPKVGSDQVQLTVDPTGEERKYELGHTLLAYMPSMNQVTALKQQGTLNYDDTIQALEANLTATSRTYLAMQSRLKDFVDEHASQPAPRE
eukprot:Clim_evm12s232 gene=Clim_evmTU12s232